MALPPTIPTSFVPHASGAPAQRFRSDLTGAFGFFAYGVLGVVFILALGVFFYGRILAAEQSSKDATLAKAEAAIDPSTVENFVRLRNRLNQSETLLKKHVAFSNFFTSLETLLPANVRFSTLHISLDPTGISKIDGTGVAKNFNALAAASIAFAGDGRIKDAIFSKISIAKDNSVSFGLSATLDPKLISFSPNVSAPSAPSTPSVPSAPNPPAASTTTP
ncbi:hypothetical protein KGQ72_02390 [Patescibacteria group bacterium]|nr:hypothetical protein [Patescibacteria group bacterium]